MPELPEVEVLVRHLRPLILGQGVSEVHIRRDKSVRPTPPDQFAQALTGACFQDLLRRGKYLVFTLRGPNRRPEFQMLGHLGMTGRLYLQPAKAPLAKHVAVVLKLGTRNFIFEDVRYFGRLTLELSALDRLGPEPRDAAFTAEYLADSLRSSGQPIKIKLLEQSLVAGVGNIYASEALFRARIHPQIPARRLRRPQLERLRRGIGDVLHEATEWGSTVPLNYAGAGAHDGLFYYGRDAAASGNYEERLAVYDRAGEACRVCETAIRRLVQAGRSTFFCPACQRRG